MNENTTATREETGELWLTHATRLIEGAAPPRVLIAPWGGVESTNGSFIVDEESAELAVEAFLKHGTDLPIDYEHQTLGGAYASPTGHAPAAGWIKRLIAQTGVGLLADIEWTADAKRMLAAKEYRYLSLVVIVRKKDRKLTAIHSVALTNKPAIVGMTPIVNRAAGFSLGDVPNADRQTADGTCPEPVGDFPDHPAVPDPPAIPPDDLLSSSLNGDNELALLRAELDLPEDADAHEMLIAAGRKLGGLRRRAREDHVRRRVGEAVCAGKLVEAQRTWAEALVAKEEGLFDEWLRTAPVVMRVGRMAPPNETSAHSRCMQTISARARGEFRGAPLLAALTTEEAYVADAVRAAGLRSGGEVGSER